MSRTLNGFLAAAALLVASPSAASSGPACCVPEVHVYAPPSIALVGSNAGVPAANGRFQVRVTDFANNPLNNMPVVVDLSGCSDLHLCADQLDATIVVDCAARTAVAHTNPLGIVTFTLLGGSRPWFGGGGPTTIGAHGRIYVQAYPQYGVEVSVSAYDLDGFGGVGANDFGNWLTDFGTGASWARSDYDGSGWIGGNDLSLWLQVFAEGWSSQSCVTACP